MYCSELNITSPTGVCDAGYYCQKGNVRPDPFMQLYNTTNSESCANKTSVGDICPIGNYCPEGSTVPLPCPAGSFGNTTGLSECHKCVAGHFCHVGSSAYTDSICPPGYFCPPGTQSANENPCPLGTYSDRGGLTESSQCQSCPGGLFCDSTNLTSPAGMCSEGYYCSSGSITAIQNSLSEGGAMCTPGFFCPEGSSHPTPCTGGYFCGSPGLAAPTGLCSPGYYCRQQSHLPTPMSNDSIGDICPVGHYCPVGSSYPEPCGAGTYSGSVGNQYTTDCISCPLGHYCSGNGLATPSGRCLSGYFCPGGEISSTPVSFFCPLGHFCLEGSREPPKCTSGYYQDVTDQDSCKLCPAGFFCDYTIEPVVLYNNSICPEGPSGTRYSSEFPFRIGTYSNITG